MKRLLLLLLLFLYFIPNLRAENLPEPYKYINVLPYDSQGWYVNSSQMKKLFKENNINIVVEVGSWLGQSTRHIATLLPRHGKIYAVDHWLGSTTQQKGEENYLPVLSHAYQQFLSNIVHAKLTSKIVPVRMNSLEAAMTLKVKPDVVYIDGEHTEEAVYEDLCAWYPFVKGYGILCGDDWGWPSVQIAVKRFAEENNLTIEAEDNFYRLRE